MIYADVVVDNNTDATDELYSYASDIEDLRPGMKVRVPFSVHNRMTDAYVARVTDSAPEGVKRFKKIAEIDPDTALTEEAMDTALWLRNRCLCRYIEAIKLFLPANTDVKKRIKDPFADIDAAPDAPPELNGEQKAALERIAESMDAEKHEAFLLHGVTGSGKTEVYLRVAGKAAEKGKGTIVLVPEIALTPQTVSRFVARFGKDSVAVLHSRLTAAQRTVEYRRIESGQVKLVIGARSAVFAPFSSIGAIIIDEEHETSYKSDKSPRYDAAEVALKRCMKHGAVLVLGSATPSVTDYYRSETGIYKRIEMLERYNSVPLPEVKIVDMGAEVRSGNLGLFSEALEDAVRKTLAAKKQVILFLNRRGYSSFVSCRECGYVVKCGECGISMAYHKDEEACICHYCGRRVPVPRVCPECGSRLIGRFGTGTQQVEEKAAELFPEAKIERLDLDALKKKGELEAVLKRFGSGKTDILIGTQIVAKGLDFSNVELVGIMSADVTLNIPDFRSAERCFQLLTQAAGRSGRGSERGKVIIQTCQPDEAAVTEAAKQDYRAFYDHEIKIRRSVQYPPFSDIFRILVSDEDPEKAERSADRCAAWLRRKLPEGIYVLGPAKTTLLKVDGMFRYQMLIKVPAGRRREISGTVSELRTVYAKAKDTAKLMSVDVNPYSMI